MRNIAFVAAIVLAIAVAAHFGFAVERAGQPAFFLIMGIPTIALALVGVFRAHRDGVLRTWFKIKGGDITIGIVSAGILFAGAYGASRVLTPVSTARESWLARLYLQLGDPTSLKKNVVYVVIGLVILAAAEEIVWRGLVPSLLEAKVGSRRAWIWSAVLYAVAHIPTIWALKDPVAGWNPIIVLAALGCGLVWGAMVRKLDRLLPAIISHAFFDWTVAMMFRLWGPSL